LHLPVRENNGQTLGLVDVMELVCSTAGGEGGKGWRDFFNDAMEANEYRDDISDTSSYYSYSASTTSKPINKKLLKKNIRNIQDNCSDVYSINLPTHQSITSSSYNFDTDNLSPSSFFIFKVTDKDGLTHRIKCIQSLEKLTSNIFEKLEFDSSTLIENLIINYIDDEKDVVVISSDNSLKDAVEFAHSSGLTSLKISVTFKGNKTKISSEVSNNIRIIPNEAPIISSLLSSSLINNAELVPESTYSDNSIIIEENNDKQEIKEKTVTDNSQFNKIIGGGIAVVATVLIGVFVIVKGRK
jgi:hypothetical protein